MKLSKRIFLALALPSALALAFQPSFAQTEITPEQRNEIEQRFNKAIEARVLQVLEEVEITETQLEPMQHALIGYFAPMQIEQAKMRAERQKMEKEGSRGSFDRNAMMERRQKLEKLRSETDKSVKGILDKKQFKRYKSAMEKIAPQQRRSPGGRGPGGGGRGGR